MTPYLEAVLLMAAAAALGVAMTLLPSLVGTLRPRPRKTQPYECGVPQHQDSRGPVSVHFYLVAMVFILFDIEVAFLLPWAVVAKGLGWAGFAEAGIFLGVLSLGLVYLVRERVFEPSRPGGRP